jgi:hypothetical protein
VTVTETVAVEARVIVAGVKLQVEKGGRLEQVRATGPLKPAPAVRARLYEALAPAGTDAEAGPAAATAKSGMNPVPVSWTGWDARPDALRVRVADSEEAVEGLKRTATEQVAPAGSEPIQVVEEVKSELPLTASVSASGESGEAPVLVNVIGSGAETTPTG